MWESYAVGLGGIVLMAVGWAGVQAAWRRTVPPAGASADPDALAARSGCGGSCGCAGVSCAEQEERRETARG